MFMPASTRSLVPAQRAMLRKARAIEAGYRSGALGRQWLPVACAAAAVATEIGQVAGANYKAYQAQALRLIANQPIAG